MTIDLFPSVNSDVTLRCTPLGCEIVRNGDTLQGNKDLATLLRACDGLSRISDILKSNTNCPENYSLASEAILPIVNNLVASNIISLSKTPCRTHINCIEQTAHIPRMISVELTDQCNLRCVYCYQNSSPQTRHPLRSPMKLLRHLKQLSVRGLELTGGEPTMHPDFPAILKYACDNFDIVGLLTNGARLKAEWLESMKMSKAIPTVQICLDGPDAESVDRTAGVSGSFDRIIRGIKLTKEYGIILRIGMILDNPGKIDLIERTAEIAYALNADAFIATPVLNFGRAKGHFLLDEPTLQHFLSVNDKLKQRYGKWFSREAEMPEQGDHSGCGAVRKQFAINWTGRCKTCVMQPMEWLDFGSAYQMESLEFQARFEDFFKLPAPGLDFCEGCSHVSYCMNCYVRAFNVLKTGIKKPSDCAWYQKNADLLCRIGFNGPIQ